MTGDQDTSQGSGPEVGPQAGTGAGTESPARTLTRSRRPKMVGGVCAGLGRYFDLDPVIFRVPLGVLSVVGGLGLVLYGFAWLLIPAEGEQQNEARWLLSGRVEGSTLSAILTALVGCGLFLASIGNHSTPFSLLLVAAVTGAAYWSHHRREAEAAEAVGAPLDPTTAHAVADAPPETQAPPVPGLPSWWQEPLTKDGRGGFGARAVWDTGYLWGPSDGGADVAGAGTGTSGRVPPWQRGGAWRGGRREPGIGGMVALLALVAWAVGTFSGWETRPLGTSLTVGLACALVVHGLGLAVSAFVGRIGFGTVILVILTAVLMAGTAMLPKDIGTDFQQVTWTPSAAAGVAPHYRLDAGAGELDLRRVRFTGHHRSVATTVRNGAGRLKVVVPAGTRVELDATVQAGEIRLPRGVSPDGHAIVDSISGLARHDRETLPPFGGHKPKGTVRLSANLELGQLELVRMLPSGERSDSRPATAHHHDPEADR